MNPEDPIITAITFALMFALAGTAAASFTIKAGCPAPRPGAGGFDIA